MDHHTRNVQLVHQLDTQHGPVWCTYVLCEIYFQKTLYVDSVDYVTIKLLTKYT